MNKGLIIAIGAYVGFIVLVVCFCLTCFYMSFFLIDWFSQIFLSYYSISGGITLIDSPVYGIPFMRVWLSPINYIFLALFIGFSIFFAFTKEGLLKNIPMWKAWT